MLRTAEARASVANLRARAGGYVVDMVIFAAIAMILTVIAGLILLLRTDWAKQDASDADLYAFLATIGLGVPVVWTVLNLALLTTRRQTGGQYVAGIRLAREDGGRLSARNAAAWWFCLNPLLFSWPMALVAGLPLAGVLALVLSNLTVVAFGVIVLLCAVSPLVALIAAATDAQNRTLHDRVVGVIVAPAG